MEKQRIICPRCGHALEITEGASFCPYCGIEVGQGGKKRGIGRALAAGVIAALLFSLVLCALGAAAFKLGEYMDKTAALSEATALSLSVRDHEGFFYPNETVKLGMEVFPPQASPKSVTWLSSDESVAAVDGTGNVSLIGEGEAVITATLDNGVEGSFTFTVAKRPYRISLNETKVKLEVGESYTFEPLVIPSDAVYGAIKWESSDSSIVSVDGDGAVKGVKQGRATVTATVAGDVVAAADVLVYKYKFDLLTNHIFENGAYDHEYGEYYVTLSYTESRENNGELMTKHYYISFFPDSDQVVLYSDMFNDEGSVCCELLVYFERSNRSSAKVQFYFSSDKYDGSILDSIPASASPKGLEINAWGRIELESYTTSTDMDFERYEGEAGFKNASLQIANALLKNSMTYLAEQWESFDLGASMSEVLGLEALQGS